MLHETSPRLDRPARALAAVALALACLGLLGWALDLAPLRRPSTAMAPIAPLGAIVLAALSSALLLHTSASVRARRATPALAAGVCATAVVEAVDRGLGLGIRLDERVLGTDAVIAPTTVMAVALVALGLLTTDASAHGRRFARLANAVAGLIGGAALVGFALGVEYFYGAGRTVQMSPQAAVAVLLLSASAAAARPGPLLTILAGPTLGGRFARTFLPLAVGVPVLTAGLATAGVRADLYSLGTAVWLMTLGGLASLLALGGWIAIRLHADDVRRSASAGRLAELAHRDPLTGALNRRAFDAEIDRAAEHLRRYGGTGAVCIIDFDRFKEINDTYGHAAGDDALVRAYRALRSRLRTTDVLGRIGGDEFAALLPRADAATADRVAADLGRVVAEVGRELGREGRPNRLTASVGTAQMTGRESATELLGRADARMYAAKRAARAA